MKSNLEFVVNDTPSVDEHNGLPHVVVMSVFWKGLLFLRAVRYLEEGEDSRLLDEDDEATFIPAKAKATGLPSKANNFAGCEDRIYLLCDLKHFHLFFDQNIKSLDEVKVLALEAEVTLVKFAHYIQTRPSFKKMPVMA